MIDAAKTRLEHEYVDPELIKTDGGTQARVAGLDPKKVDEYAQLYREGVQLPPVVVFYDGETYWCADGHHRVAAAIAAELAEVDVQIHEGGKREALRVALGANATHGLARSNADKRNAVTIALVDEEWSKLSDREIAKMCGVSHTMVSNLRRELAPSDTDTDEEPNVPGDEELDTGDIDNAILLLAGLLKRWGATDACPTQLGLAHAKLTSALKRRDLSDVDWEEIVAEGVHKGLWVVDEEAGTIWLAEATPGGAAGTAHRPHGEGVGQPSPAAETLGSTPGPGTPSKPRPSALPPDEQAPEPAAPNFFDRSLDYGRLNAASPQLRSCADHASRVLDQGLGGHAKITDLRHFYQNSRKEKISNAHWYSILGCGLEAGLWTIVGGETGRIRLAEGAAEKRPSGPDQPQTVGAADPIAQAPEPGPAAGVEEADEGASISPSLSPEALAAEVAQERAARVGLPNEERAANDAYWTPDQHARGIVRWLDERFFASTPPARVLEPSVGGGAFIGPIQETWPDARVEAIDVDPLAPGLQYADSSTAGDYMEIITTGRYDLCVGNPPYREDLVAWIERSRRSARVVAYLLRASFAGGVERQEWFSGSGKPSHVVVLSPRPKWEGPGARKQTDQADSYLFVWVEGHVGPTQMHFVNVRELQ